MKKEPVDDEIAHFRALDIQVSRMDHEQKLAKIKADKEVALVVQRRRNQLATWTKYVVTPILAISLLGSTTGVIIMGAKSGPPESPEVAQIKAKEKRAKACTEHDNDIGAQDHTWWPEAAGGEGLCLPKDQTPPS